MSLVACEDLGHPSSFFAALQKGALDPSFGSNGILIIPWPHTLPYSVVLGHASLSSFLHVICHHPLSHRVQGLSLHR